MIKHTELIERAEILSKQSSEIEWRDSIKHSYYYFYHELKQFLSKHKIDLMDKSYGEHQFAIEKLKSIENRSAKSLARYVQILKDKRVISCYKLDASVSQFQAIQQLKECQNAIIKLKELDTLLQEK
ncbi:hypothetical protein [Glaesserella parasuis]|uniref:hypothetical protein n=1 Tax=Glaesserella parasuis TaxID=738 RepID=UPI0021BFD827|nr:hypothetical protein [Glaesserella parasuis]MCT8565502.1 hypothetical protein [Glaesserella parasuis]MCT8680073.1 hypothetical protein [Glaesserella parasuis]MDG6236327.1 hypothetical protein [Glaesserella parasuis]MDG6429604.1 hypothetical protein [Glaesserella parasuis]MDG6818954.1 hypothetical protein [Glaesserella parasuis]